MQYAHLPLRACSARFAALWQTGARTPQLLRCPGPPLLGHLDPLYIYIYIIIYIQIYFAYPMYIVVVYNL